jgi:hypothetical protein
MPKARSIGCQSARCMRTGNTGFNRSATAKKAHIQPRGPAWNTLSGQYPAPTVATVRNSM